MTLLLTLNRRPLVYACCVVAGLQIATKAPAFDAVETLSTIQEVQEGVCNRQIDRSEFRTGRL